MNRLSQSIYYSSNLNNNSETEVRSLKLMETWVKAPFLREAPILIVGGCIQSTFPRIWKRFAENRIVLTSCPEAEGFSGLVEKLAMIIRCSNPKEMILLTVDGSPHCNMLHISVNGAAFITKVKTPIRHFVIVGEGEVNEVSSESVRVGRYLHLVEKCVQKCPELISDLERLSREQQDIKKDVSTSSY